MTHPARRANPYNLPRHQDRPTVHQRALAWAYVLSAAAIVGYLVGLAGHSLARLAGLGV